MRILIYIDSMNPAGGIERVVSKHLYFFSKKNQVTLLTKDNLDSFYNIPVEITKSSMNLLELVDMKTNKVNRAIKTIKQLFITRKHLANHINNNDLIYCTHIRNLLELYIAGADMKKVIVTEHGSYFGYNKIYRKLKKILYPKCKYIVSPTTMDYEIYKNQNCNVVYIPNPLSFYNNNTAKLNTNIVINIGRLTNDKRQNLLIEIWRTVSSNHPEWKLIIVGKGENKSHLTNLIINYNLQEKIKIIEPMKNIEDFILNSSIFAFTSKFEGFGMVLAEAMSCGVPCISFNCPSGPRDIIENNIDGFLIHEDHINDYTSKLNLLIADQELRINMGKKAKENIKKFLDFEIEKQWFKLLDEMK